MPSPRGGGDGYVLSFEYAREKMPALKDSSALWAFVSVANWLFGSEQYGDGVYARMAETFGFENRLPKGE